jgi:protein-L-isoaspartate(D-aspartate) O-methyltransferase
MINTDTDVDADDIQSHRAHYASSIAANAGGANERLVAAFASVRREHFVGPGPWTIDGGGGYIQTASADLRLLYQDIVVALATDRGIHNGRPSLHAECMQACQPAPDETVVHIGTGTGYYTAILASMIGAHGAVVGFEIEPDIAERARRNLAHLSNVSVMTGSATESALPNADVIYVSAGATHPLPAWLDALQPGGRLIFPLTPDAGLGCMLLVRRVAMDSFAASCLSTVAFIPCIGARDRANSTAVADAMNSGTLASARSLHRTGRPDHTVCCEGLGWWLSTAEPEHSH